MAKFNRREARERRHKRLRQRVVGTPERPRLNVYRSLHHIHAQIIDDSIGHTLVSASSVEPNCVRSWVPRGGIKRRPKKLAWPWRSAPKKRALHRWF